MQQLGLHELARLRIERGERLVHQQDLGIGGERAREVDALLHAARQLGRIPPLEALEPDELEEVLRAVGHLGG